MSSRTPVPQSVRKEALDSAGHRCELCPARGTRVGGEAALHLHHRESPRNGGTHDPENLVVLCEDCHHHHHSSRTTPDDIETDLETMDIDPTPADLRLINAIEEIAPASTGELAEDAGISDVHALRRLYALAAAKLICKTTDQKWDFADRVDEPLGGELPTDPEQAARHARDDIIRRMADQGMGHAKIADIVGLSERTIPIAINRARAFDPPVPPLDGSNEPDLVDLSRRVASLERQLDQTT